MKVEAGQTIFLKRVGNNTRNRKPDDMIVESVVSRVGRSYFYVNQGWRESKFYIEDGREFTSATTMGGPNWRAYSSQQEILDEQETIEIANGLADVFRNWGGRRLGLDRLRRIQAIVDEE